MKHADPYLKVKVFRPSDPDSLENALRTFKQKLQKNGIFRELKERRFFVCNTQKKKGAERASILRIKKRESAVKRTMK